MSTNKTERYNLHLWEPGDDFLREEFNENFEALDAAARVVYGSYVGDGTEEKRIELGFTPAAVLIETDSGRRDGYQNGTFFGGLVAAEAVNNGAALTQGGFVVCGFTNARPSGANYNGTVYLYWALV